MLDQHGRRTVNAVIVALVLSGMIAGVALATTWTTSCSSSTQKICNYKNINLQVPLAAVNGDVNDYANDKYPNTQDGINDSVSSTVNWYSANKVLWYTDAGPSGSSMCVPPLTAATYVGDAYNDKFSSHVVGLSSTC